MEGKGKGEEGRGGQGKGRKGASLLLVPGFRHPGNTQNPPDFGRNPVEKKTAKNPHQTIQFQFVMSVITTDFFMFTASNDQ